MMMAYRNSPVRVATPDRREFIFQLAAGIGSVALSSLIRQDEVRAGILAAKKPHHPAKARACIFLLMEGGPSHIDTFDPKPKLQQLHLTEFVRESQYASAMESGKRYYVSSPFKFIRSFRTGLEISEHYEPLMECVGDICFYRGLVAESTNHPTALYHLNTGNKFGGDPAAGAWVTYGLGTLNENLPAFVVLPDIIHPQGGSANWSNGFLPAQYQGTEFRPNGPPILDLNPPSGVAPEAQRQNLDLLRALNDYHQERQPWHGELAARIESYELAYRMQAEVPAVVDIEKEPEETRRMYGIGEKETDGFGRRCLLARRLVANGVRFVQVYSTGWDSHDYIERAHSNRMRATAKPIAGLLKDLKRTGLLESTLVVWGGEFGRSPDNGIRGGAKAFGRDHNARAMTVWLAGGGVKPGEVIGATDEIGQQAVEVVHSMPDFHVTLLHLLGLDDARLRYFHQGREKQLSQFGGRVIKELLA
jgi:Protein of unknown function (DUF1501)